MQQQSTTTNFLIKNDNRHFSPLELPNVAYLTVNLQVKSGDRTQNLLTKIEFTTSAVASLYSMSIKYVSIYDCDEVK